MPHWVVLICKEGCFHNSSLKEFGGRCAFTRLLCVTPLLEELLMDGIELERWKWSSTVSSPSLRRLTIGRQVWEPYIVDSDGELICLDCRCLAYDFDSISLDIPGLTYLEYSDYVPKEFMIVNLNSLVEAKSELEVDNDSVWKERHANDFNPMNLINGIKNVEILDFDVVTMEMFYVFIEALPVFENLYRISVDPSNFCWSLLPRLIKNSPNLKTLIIEGSLHYDVQHDSFHSARRENKWVCPCVSEYSFLLSCPVEVFEITDYSGSVGEVEEMKHFLNKLSCLKLVKVRARVSSDKRDASHGRFANASPSFVSVQNQSQVFLKKITKSKL